MVNSLLYCLGLHGIASISRYWCVCPSVLPLFIAVYSSCDENFAETSFQWGTAAFGCTTYVQHVGKASMCTVIESSAAAPSSVSDVAGPCIPIPSASGVGQFYWRRFMSSTSWPADCTGCLHSWYLPTAVTYFIFIIPELLATTVVNRASQHGTDLLGVMSKILNDVTVNVSSPPEPAALALESLKFLCEEEVCHRSALFVYVTVVWCVVAHACRYWSWRRHGQCLLENWRTMNAHYCWVNCVLSWNLHLIRVKAVRVRYLSSFICFMVDAPESMERIACECRNSRMML